MLCVLPQKRQNQKKQKKKIKLTHPNQLIVAIVLTLINFTLTTIIHYCCGLSPRLNLTTNTILLILWLASLAVLSWSMSQTILTTCNETFWANSTGISICRIYKTFFSFTVVATASFIAAVTLDIIIRKRQTRLGSYDPMNNSHDAMLADLKLGNRNESGSGSAMSGGVAAAAAAAGGGAGAGYGAGAVPDDRSVSEYSYRGDGVSDSHGFQRPGAPAATYGVHDHLEQYHADEAQGYSDAAPGRGVWGVPRVRYSALDRSGYGYPTEQTSYDPGAYR